MITIGSDVIQPDATVRDLSVQLDSELNMKHRVNTLARTCFYHLRRLRQVRRRAGYEVTVRLVLTGRYNFRNGTERRNAL